MKKKLCKEKSDSSVRLKNRDDINLKTPFCGTSLNIILDFWLITLIVQLYFFIATLKVWIYYNLQLLHTFCILIHLLMQPSGFLRTKKCQLKVLQSIFKVKSLFVFNSREWPKQNFSKKYQYNTKPQHFQDRGHSFLPYGPTLSR